MKLNFNTIPDFTSQKYEPLPEGEYRCQLKHMELTQSKKNEPMIICEFKVLNDPTGFKDRTIKEYIVLTNEFNLSKLKKLLSLSGLNTTEDIDLELLVNNGDLIGKKFDLFIKTNSYTNQFNKEVINNKLAGFVE